MFNQLVIVTLWRSLLCSLQKFPPAIQRYQDLQKEQTGREAARKENIMRQALKSWFDFKVSFGVLLLLWTSYLWIS